MSLSICVRFLAGRYDAALTDRVTPEWPPHPARLFCALVSVACEAADDAALAWLERQPSPTIIAPRKPLAVSAQAGFVVLGDLTKAGKNGVYPGRSTVRRERVGIRVAAEEITFVWPHAEPSQADLLALRRMTAQVPYFGRSSSPATLSVETGGRECALAFHPVVTPRRRVDEDEIFVRVPFEGYLAALRTRHAAGDRAWEASRAVPYGWGHDRHDDERRGPLSSGWSDLIVFGFARGVLLEGMLLVRVTHALRSSILRRVQDAVGSDTSLPLAVHGHHEVPTPYGPAHLAFLALPFVGSAHADGRLLGVAIAIPASMAAADRLTLLRVLIGPHGLTHLSVPGAGRLEISYDASRTRPWGLLKERWTRASRAWVTATPIVPDSYAKRANWAAAVARSIVHAGLPEPDKVETASHPLLDGVARLAGGELPVRGSRYPPLMHARISFPDPIEGPVLAGRFRYAGLGLFAPCNVPAGSEP